MVEHETVQKDACNDEFLLAYDEFVCEREQGHDGWHAAYGTAGDRDWEVRWEPTD